MAFEKNMTSLKSQGQSIILRENSIKARKHDKARLEYRNFNFEYLSHATKKYLENDAQRFFFLLNEFY